MLTETTSEILESTRDSAFKLFGKTIPLHDNFNSVTASTSCGGDGGDDADENLDRPSCSDSSVRDDTDGNRVGEEVEILKDVEIEKSTECKLGDGALKELSEESSNPEASSLINESPKTLSNEKDSISSKPSQIEEQQNDTSNSSLQEKPLKKPDKILPCPRCNSMETKFCYYNNYNMNQPRHFCKKCQRYWTAGGTMRNVPVGAGRRKNKNSASQYRHITVGEGLQTARLDVPNGRHLPELKANGTILNFGPDRPLHESMASILNLTDKTVRTRIRNGFHKPEALSVPVSHGISDDSDKNSNASSIVESTLKDEASRSIPQDMLMANCQGFPPPVPCFPGAPWPYSWNSAQWTSSISPSAFCPPGFPMPVYPAAAYFGCVIPSTWNMPCHPLTSSPTQIGKDSGPNSPTLGKHSRDEDMFKVSNPGSTESKEHQNSQAEAEPGNENTTKRNLWIPKTLRIADPNEAAKSSIWTTLGIKNEASDSTSSKELFKAFEPKGNEKQHANETSTVLQSNPAAYSRSLNFHESL